jgi:glycerol-3-phosphate cytidylyltransferase
MRFLNRINEYKKQGKKIGFTASTFDLFHAGHCLMIEESKAECDILVVAILTDPTNDRPETKMKPKQTLLERWIQASANGFIDILIPIESEEDLYNLLLIIEPDIRFVGSEYKGKDFTASELCIDIFFNKRNHDYSSSKLKKK